MRRGVNFNQSAYNSPTLKPVFTICRRLFWRLVFLKPAPPAIVETRQASLNHRFKSASWLRGLIGSVALFPLMDYAHGLTLGDIEPLSALGQPFQARVPYRLVDGETLDSQCLHLPGKRTETPLGLPELVNAVLRVEALEGGGYIVLQSAEKTTEPVLQLTLEVRCEKSDKLTRQYLVLLDPPERFSRPAIAPASAASVLPPQRKGGLAPQYVTTAPVSAATAAPEPQAIVAAPSPVAAPRPRAPTTVAASTLATPARTDVPRALPVAEPHPRAPAVGEKSAHKPSAKRDVLRLSPTIVEAERDADQKPCCFRLDYELREREGKPVTEAERELLRREFDERMAEGEMVPRLLSLHDQMVVLNGQILAKESERAANAARRELEAQSERYAWVIAIILGAATLGAGGWLWLRRTHRSPFDTDSLYDNGPQPPTLTAAVNAAGKESGPVVASGTLPNRAVLAEAQSGNLSAPNPLEPASTQAESSPRHWPSPVETRSAALAAGDGPAAVRMHESAYVPEMRGGEPQSGTTYQEPQSPETGITFDLDSDEKDSDEEESAAPVIDLVLDSTPGKGLDVNLDWLTADGDDGIPGRPGSEGGTTSTPGTGQARGDNTGHFADLMGGGFSSPPGMPTLELADGSDAGKPEATQRAKQYREAYFAERFPEIAAGSIVLSNSASVVEGARIMYQEDQDVSRAVELLQLAWSSYRENLGLWLCLFEIYWLEGMRAPFIELARRFLENFSTRHKDWPMIARLGRELDATNVVFRADGLPAVQEGTPNWLNAELDMMGQVLSREMRDQVLEVAAPAALGNEPGQKR